MSDSPWSSSWQRRLAEELADDGIELPGDEAFGRLLLEELDHCRRSPVFEGRQPPYGAMIVPADGVVDRSVAMSAHVPFDVVPLDDDASKSRIYADGVSSYLVRTVGGGHGLACFERAILFESDLVQVQELTGATIVQRTPALHVVRFFTDGAVVSWDGRHWRSRPTAKSLRNALTTGRPESAELLCDIAELAIHWLAPSGVGATIVLAHAAMDPACFDSSTAAHTPAMSVSNRRHFSALVTVLRQHDLAVIVDAEGTIRKVSVGLRWSPDAEAAVDNDRGMRHRSAQRFSHDQPDATVVVVSEDGPVTVYRDGNVLAATRVEPAVTPPTMFP